MNSKRKKKVEEIEDPASASKSGYSSDSNQDSSEASGSDAGKSQYAKVNRVSLDKESDEYRKKRQRNNIAVKKSRHKSKIKTMQTLERVNALKAENEQLQQKIVILSKELALLKQLFLAHAQNAHNSDLSESELKELFSNETYQELIGGNTS
ncbi:CCAAT/enhancer-binding protein gamma [Tetranychus urticae]|uniref:BZIP domain-containing protein n=1 Tax=Tetranychus urticae TaxID=32264 RepID=T1KGQ3_TETUR|nr:CCAAT/enhancer-binding protein gamma [Tetranychus urticae]